MSIWVIGDVQGCYDELIELLQQPEITQDSDTKIWFAGDLINRGPKSLEVLRLVKSLGTKAQCVLGNHDIHILALAAGVRDRHPLDTAQEILLAPDAQELIDWLRHQPLAVYESNYLMVHAGVLPDWTLEETLEHAHSIESVLRSENWTKEIKSLFGNEPNHPSKVSSPEMRRRLAVNAFTRLRYCLPDGSLEFKYKGPIDNKPDELTPWFDMTPRKTSNLCVVFGHWSSLGLINKTQLLALDTGCIWGGALTAVRLDDRKVLQVPSAKSKHLTAI